jgi:hypothetical protein
MHVHLTLSRRTARASARASLVLTVLGTASFIAGSFAYHALGSVLGLCLIFTVPACVLFLFSLSRVQMGNLSRAIIFSVIGGAIMVAAAIGAAIASAYANPCFEIAPCTRGPNFAYPALIAAMIAFLITAALGLLVSPAALGFASQRRRAHNQHNHRYEA